MMLQTCPNGYTNSKRGQSLSRLRLIVYGALAPSLHLLGGNDKASILPVLQLHELWRLLTQPLQYFLYFAAVRGRSHSAKKMECKSFIINFKKAGSLWLGASN